MAEKTYDISVDRFVDAFRRFNEYDDKWVEAQEELGGVQDAGIDTPKVFNEDF